MNQQPWSISFVMLSMGECIYLIVGSWFIRSNIISKWHIHNACDIIFGEGTLCLFSAKCTRDFIFGASSHLVRATYSVWGGWAVSHFSSAFPTQVLFANQTTSQHLPGCGCSHGLVVSNFRSTFWFASTRYGPLHQGDTVDTKQGICSKRYASYCSSYRWLMSVSAHHNIIKSFTFTPKLILDCQLLRILRPWEQDLRRG